MLPGNHTLSTSFEENNAVAKIPVSKIIVNRVEGPTRELKGPRTAATFKEANRILAGWALSAPPIGYDKVDFKVEWADGNSYTGLYDLVREDASRASLDGHIREVASFYAGLRRPHDLDQDKYEFMVKSMEQTSGMQRSEWGRLLENYELS